MSGIQSHFRELNRIRKEEGLVAAAKYDIKETVRDIGMVADDTLMYGMVGLGLAFAWVASPFAIAYGSLANPLWAHGRRRDALDEAVPHAEKTFRQKFNSVIRSAGNQLAAPVKRELGYGLGDFLTEDLNFRRVGAAAGILAPAVAVYNSHMDGGPLYSVVMGTTLLLGGGPITGAVSAVTGTIGYAIGDGVDQLIGNKPKESDNNQRTDLVPAS